MRCDQRIHEDGLGVEVRTSDKGRREGVGHCLVAGGSVGHVEREAHERIGSRYRHSAGGFADAIDATVTSNSAVNKPADTIA